MAGGTSFIKTVMRVIRLHQFLDIIVAHQAKSIPLLGQHKLLWTVMRVVAIGTTIFNNGMHMFTPDSIGFTLVTHQAKIDTRLRKLVVGIRSVRIMADRALPRLNRAMHHCAIDLAVVTLIAKFFTGSRQHFFSGTGMRVVTRGAAILKRRVDVSLPGCFIIMAFVTEGIPLRRQHLVGRTGMRVMTRGATIFKRRVDMRLTGRGVIVTHQAE